MKVAEKDEYVLHWATFFAGRGKTKTPFQRPEDLPEGDFRRTSPRFSAENFQRNLDLVREVQAIAQAKPCKPSQVALAWVLAQGDDVVPIPGTKRRSDLEENVGALDVHLASADLVARAFPGSTYVAASHVSHAASRGRA